jgi:hypothetical protein
MLTIYLRKCGFLQLAMSVRAFSVSSLREHLSIFPSSLYSIAYNLCGQDQAKVNNQRLIDGSIDSPRHKLSTSAIMQR